MMVCDGLGRLLPVQLDQSTYDFNRFLKPPKEIKHTDLGKRYGPIASARRIILKAETLIDLA